MYFIDWRGVVYFFNPHKDMVSITKQVNLHSALLAKGDLEARSQHYTVAVFLFLGTLHLFSLWSATLATEWEQLVAANFFYFLQLEQFFTVIFGALFLYSIYLYRILEFNTYKHNIFAHLADLILRDKRQFIFNSGKNFIKYGQLFWKYFGQPAVAFTCFIISYYIISMLFKFSKYSFTTPDAYFGLLSGLAKMIIFSVALGLFVKVSCYASVFAYLLLEMLHTRIKLSARILRAKPKEEAFIKIIKMNAFIRRTAVTMGAVFDLNSLIGSAFISFLMIGCPMNAIMFIWILLQKEFKLIIAGIVIMVLCQLGLIFGLHLYCAQFSNTLHGTFKMLLWFPPRLVKCSLRHRIRLSDAIWRLWTKKKYGIKFIWLISIFSFTKFIVMYVRFLMFSYKYFK